MSFHEVQFPVDISYGSVGGPGFNTGIVETDSGNEERVQRWAGSGRRKYNAAYGVKDMPTLATLISFHIARQGATNGFRYKDFFDFTTASDHQSAITSVDVDIGVGTGSQTQFQLIKKYTSGPVTRTRNITKPVSGTTKVALDDVEQSSGFSVSTTTGIVTFTTPPANGVVVSAGCEFDVPVRFDISVDDFLPLTHDFFGSGSVSDIPLVEIIDETEVSEEFYYGGAKNHGAITASVTLSLQDGRVQSFAQTITGLSAILPDPVANNIPLGDPHFLINNIGTQSLTLALHTGTSLKVMTANSLTTVFLGLNSSDVKTWYAYS